MFGVSVGPLIGRLIDRLVPWYATLVATFLQLVFQSVQTGAGGINIAAVVIACFGLDVGRQMQQVSLTTAVYGISESARSRMNAVLIICVRRALSPVEYILMLFTDLHRSSHWNRCWHEALHSIRLAGGRCFLIRPLRVADRYSIPSWSALRTVHMVRV